MSKQNGAGRKRNTAAENDAEWLEWRRREMEMNQLPLDEHERELAKMSADDLHSLMCAMIARNVEEGRYTEFLYEGK